MLRGVIMLRNGLSPLQTTRGSTSAGMSYGIFQSHGKSFRIFTGGGGQLVPDYPSSIEEITKMQIIIRKVIENRFRIICPLISLKLNNDITTSISTLKSFLINSESLIRSIATL